MPSPSVRSMRLGGRRGLRPSVRLVSVRREDPGGAGRTYGFQASVYR